MTTRFKALRGMRDILPDEVGRWELLETTAREVFRLYGYREIRTPVMESSALFSRSVGESSDIVRKEMYTLQRGEESMTLRPECTAPVVRAFVEHSRHRGVADGYPERLFYIGPMFRHERPQKGRLRQFHQIGVEVLGSSEPLAEAEMLQMLDLFLGRLGIVDRELVIGSVGDEACRPRYRETLREWLRTRIESMCDDCRRRFDENPLRVFDCKIEADRKLLEDAPRIVDELCDDCDAHFAAVRGFLDTFALPYRVDGSLVRGLDYYRRTVFEVTAGGLGAQNAVLGGGRYDRLVEELGGPPIPGVGFAMGMERTILLLPDAMVPAASVDVALIGLGAEGWRACAALAARIRDAGVSVLTPLVERPMGAQLRRADRAGARFAMFVGDDEIRSGRYGFKELATGAQSSLTESEILARVGERND